MWRTSSPPFCLLIEEWFWIGRSGTSHHNEEWHLFFFSLFFSVPAAAASTFNYVLPAFSALSAPGLPVCFPPMLPQQGLPPSGRWRLVVGSSELDDGVSLYSRAWLLTAQYHPYHTSATAVSFRVMASYQLLQCPHPIHPPDSSPSPRRAHRPNRPPEN